mgnify:CR=1 FL=1
MKKIIKPVIEIFLWIAIPVILVAFLYQFEMGILIVCVYGFTLLLLAARIMTLLWLKPLECSREISDDVIPLSESVKVTVRIRNPHPWPMLWAYAQETLPPRIPVNGTTKRLFFLPPGRTVHLFYELKLNQRGCYQLGPAVIETGDIFGLFRKSRLDKKRDFVTVLPRYSVIEEINVGQRRMLGDFTARRSLIDDPSRIQGVREYRRGDPMKHIHWKSSAHAGELQTRVFEPVTEAGATVILDFYEDAWKEATMDDPNHPPSEIAVDTACSICRYLWDGNWKVGFLSNGRDPLGIPGITVSQAKASDTLSAALEAARMGIEDDRLEPLFIPARRAEDQFMLIHENLGRISLSDGLFVEQVMLDKLSAIEREQVLVIITGRVTDPFIEAVLRIRAMGYRMMIFIVKNSRAHDKAFQAFIPAGIEVFDLEHERRLTEVATGRRFL